MIGIGISTQHQALAACYTKAGRLFLGDANTLYVQMPNIWGSALSHRLQKGVYTAATSLGAPAQPWRRTSCVEIATVDSSPTSGAIFSFTQLSNTGALDYAFQNNPAGFIFGGSFHGGETIAAEQWYVDGVAFIPGTTPTEGDIFRLERTTLIDWGSGRTMTVAFALQFNADGSIDEEGSCASSSAFATQYVGMDILTPDFGERRNGSNIVTTTVDSDVTGDAADITYRAPGSGYAVQIVSNIPNATRYQRAHTDAQQTQVKHYPQIASTAGNPFNTVSWERRVSFSKGAPNPFYWSGPANGESGFANVAGYDAATWDGANKQLVLARAAGSVGRRVVFPIAGLTPGQGYTLTGNMAIAGSSPSAGVTIGISPNANGASAVALANAIDGNYASAVAGAAITASTMYLSMNQAFASGSDNVLRLNEWKLSLP